MKTFVGIDPGASGGIAFVSETAHAWAFKMPETDRDILDEFLVAAKDRELFACLEFVASSPQMGVKSAFTFGKGWGGLRMALVAAEIPFETVTPAKWQGAMACRSGGDKNVTKRRAQELFPSLKVTHAVADALLIAEYARRTFCRISPAAPGAEATHG